MMLPLVEGAALDQRRSGTIHQPQHPRHRQIKHRLIQFARFDRGDQRHITHPEVWRHLQIQAAPQRSDPVMNRTPIRNHDAVRSPLVAQHLGQQPTVLRAVRAVQLVVGAHHRPRVGAGDDALEGWQIDLPQCALIHLRADPQPVVFLVVGRIMLERRPDAEALNTLHHRGGQLAREVRIFGQVLEVPTAQR